MNGRGHFGIRLARPRCPRFAVLLAVVWLELPACAGKSDGQKQSGGTAGTSAGSSGSNAGSGGEAARGTSGSAGSAQSGCEYNGVRYELGESFGTCNECVCTPSGGVSCGMGCAEGGHAGVMSGGGRAGTLAGDAGSGGGPEGGRAATAGASGAGAGGASGGAGMTAGLGGDAGSEPGTEDCTLMEGELCVVGTPRGGGHELVEGMPMLFTIRAAGCLSSSCTELVSADCNYLGSDHEYYLGAFFCVNVTEGGACTADCGGTPQATCDLDIPLTAGEYTVHVSGNAGSGLSTLRFTVPGVIAEEDRCTYPLVR